MTPTQVTPNSFEVTEKALDHAVDVVAVVGVVAAASMGSADMTVVGGLVSIALGKRVLKSASA